MKLSAPYIIDMLEKADCKMTLNNGDNTILFAIIYGFQRVGLERTYIELRKVFRKSLFIKIFTKKSVIDYRNI